MKYGQIEKAYFESRPNRFIAYVDRLSQQEKVHVKNTGRCRELLLPGAEVYLARGSEDKKEERKTKYDLVAVKKGERIINMDSQAPNQAVYEWLLEKKLFPDLVSVRPETTYGDSRFDFYVETQDEKIFLEVKGVTLERDGVVLFPDAPSERAVKHVKELITAARNGFGAYLIFVIQMQDVQYFMPNEETQPEFAEVLREARREGVKILAYDCQVTPQSMEIRKPVPVKLSLLDRIEKPLLSWYDRGRRILPWREDPTPYHVWVSETRVEAVKPYYDRFMQTLPDIASLAAAEEETLLKLWEGLGYYNRVRNLNKAAVMIMEEYGGRMPDEYEEIQKLPGIGSYTAGAIASIAYHRKAPAVDGNVLRVLGRLRMDGGDIMQQSVKKRVEEELFLSMGEERPGDFNQALMELGAMVCIPNGEPRCGQCPWENLCLAHREGKTVLIILDENRAALCKRPSKGLLAGMYEFPSISGKRTEEEVLSYLKDRGLSVLRIEPLRECRHIFTHKEWHMTGYFIRVDELSRQTDGEYIFAEKNEAKDKYPIPSAYDVYRKYFYEKIV